MPLSGYEGVDIEIVLPGNLTVYDIDWLAVWCVKFKHNFGHVLIPKDLNVPPALGQTKIAVTSFSYAVSSALAAEGCGNTSGSGAGTSDLEMFVDMCF